MTQPSLHFFLPFRFAPHFHLPKYESQVTRVNGAFIVHSHPLFPFSSPMSICGRLDAKRLCSQACRVGALGAASAISYVNDRRRATKASS